MTPGALKALLGFLLFALFVGAGGYAVWSYRSMAAEVAELKPLKDQVAALAANQAALSAEVVRRAEFDTHVRTARQSVHIKLDKAIHEDPVSRSYLGERIPDGVREAFRPAP